MGLVWLGAVLYKLGKLRYPTASQDTKNTTTHNNQHERRRPTHQRLWPSPSMGRPAAPPTDGASAPQHHTQAASRRACASCCWFACLGGRNERHQKIERGGSALALGGRRFKCLNNNQMGGGSTLEGALEKRRGWVGTCGEDGCPSFGGSK